MKNEDWALVYSWLMVKKRWSSGSPLYCQNEAEECTWPDLNQFEMYFLHNCVQGYWRVYHSSDKLKSVSIHLFSSLFFKKAQVFRYLYELIRQQNPAKWTGLYWALIIMISHPEITKHLDKDKLYFDEMQIKLSYSSWLELIPVKCAKEMEFWNIIWIATVINNLY